MCEPAKDKKKNWLLRAQLSLEADSETVQAWPLWFLQEIRADYKISICLGTFFFSRWEKRIWVKWIIGLCCMHSLDVQLYNPLWIVANGRKWRGLRIGWLNKIEEQVKWGKGSEGPGSVSGSNCRMSHLYFTSKVEKFKVMNYKVQDVALGVGESKWNGAKDYWF